MAHINFIIPSKKSELLSSGDYYYVKCISDKKGLLTELRNAKTALREEGVEYILENFDTYYSVLYYDESVDMDVLFKSYEDLHKATLELNKALGFILEDPESLNDELKLKFLNILKMTIYVYTETIISIEQRHRANDEQVVRVRKGKKNTKDQDFVIDKQGSLIVLNNILQRDISQFWDPPVVEEMFINKICAVCFQFLEKPAIKNDKESLNEIFSIFGYLLKNYNYGCTFVLRATQMIKTHEHMSQCLPKGIQHIVTEFKCKSLLHDLIEELTEWQIDDKSNDAQGARFCSVMLSALASLMPDLMIPEITSLNVYLHYEPPSLRLSVVNVMVEVILNNLTSHNSSEEQKKFRDELFEILMEHVNDNAGLVRAKVLQQLARLQQENAIPLKYQIPILELAIQHLRDKAVLARKCAANCVTTFLSYNAFSAVLSLKEVSQELEKKCDEQQKFIEQIPDSRIGQLLTLQEPWDNIVDKLQEIVKRILEDTENVPEENGDAESFGQMLGSIRKHLNEDNLEAAVHLCTIGLKKFDMLKQLRENSKDDFNVYMNLLHAAFFDTIKAVEEYMSQGFVTTIKDLDKLNTMNKHIDFLKDCVKFLNEIDRAIDLMVDLLETTSVSDMQEAIHFFIAAYQFQIDRSEVGILSMLKLMQRNEQDRKDAVVEAFKTIYLTTDTADMSQHSIVILNRLMKFLKTVPLNAMDDLEEIVSKWCASNILDNSVINVMWQYVTQKIKVSEEDECAAMELLRMCALGRKRIITSNLELVMSIAVTRGNNNMKLLGICCRTLAVAYEKVEIESQKGPNRLDPEDEGFTKSIQILIDNFFKPVEFYNKALTGVIEFVYKMCKKPEQVCQVLLNSVYPTLVKMSQEGKDKIQNFVLIRVCQMCGFIALKQLEFMDDSVYKELKRRQNMRDGQKKKKSSDKKNASRHNATDMSVADQSTILEGAQAEDLDAEFILNVLEKDTVTGSGGLFKFSPWLIAICEKPSVFQSVELQGAAIIAVMRYMLVSSKFASQHIRLMFTIFANTKNAEIKTNILIHLHDLLVRFPNIVEPWTSKIFESLDDSTSEVRFSTFFILSGLILKDLIRAHSYIPKMAVCLVDQDEQLIQMCKLFLLKLSHKENNLYNALPDIFTHALMKETITDEGIHDMMKFLFELIDQSKHMESLVDRFCSKFQLTEDKRQHRNISYCLSLIRYSEKGLRKLIDNFALFKHVLHDEHIYADFKTIMQNANKTQVGKADLKPIVTELENLINSVFSLDENGLMPPKPPAPPKSAKKPRQQKKKSAKKSRNSDDSMDEDTDISIRKSTRKRKPTRKVTDSDSD